MSDSPTFASSDHTITITTGANTAARQESPPRPRSIDDMVERHQLRSRRGDRDARSPPAPSSGVAAVPPAADRLGIGLRRSVQRVHRRERCEQRPAGTASSPALTTVTPPQDAQMTLYRGTAAAQTVTSSTNKFSSITAGRGHHGERDDHEHEPGQRDRRRRLDRGGDLCASIDRRRSSRSSRRSPPPARSRAPRARAAERAASATRGSVFTGDPLVRTVNDALLTAVSGAVEREVPVLDRHHPDEDRHDHLRSDRVPGGDGVGPRRHDGDVPDDRAAGLRCREQRLGRVQRIDQPERSPPRRAGSRASPPRSATGTAGSRPSRPSTRSSSTRWKSR